MQTPRNSASDEQRTAMLQNAGMPALHQLQPIDGAMAQRFDQGFRAPADAAGVERSFAAPPKDALPVQVGAGMDPGLAVASATGRPVAFQAPVDSGFRVTRSNSLDPALQDSARRAFEIGPASQGQSAAAQPSQGTSFDLSQIKDPGLRAWAEYHKDSPRSVIDGENIVTRYLKKNGYLPMQGGAATQPVQAPDEAFARPSAVDPRFFEADAPHIYTPAVGTQRIQVPAGAFDSPSAAAPAGIDAAPDMSRYLGGATGRPAERPNRFQPPDAAFTQPSTVNSEFFQADAPTLQPTMATGAPIAVPANAFGPAGTSFTAPASAFTAQGNAAPTGFAATHEPMVAVDALGDDVDYAQLFKQRNSEDLAAAFNGRFSPAVRQALSRYGNFLP